MKSISTILRFLLPDCSFRIISIGLIVVASTGVCRVESITTLDMKGVPKDVEYYSLIPLGQGGKIYARVDSSQDKMRPVISDVIAAIIGFIFVQTEIKKCEKLVES